MFSKILKMKLVEKDMNSVDLAKLLGCSTSNLYQSFRSDNFTEDRMKKIADLLNCDLVISLKDKV